MVAWLLAIHIDRADRPSARLFFPLRPLSFAPPLAPELCVRGQARGVRSGKLRLSTRDNK